MSTLIIETKDQATTEKIIWFLSGLKSQGVRIVSKDSELPVSKNTPNAETIAAFNETNLESMSMDEFTELCR